MKIIWLLVFLALMISADGSRVGRSMQSGDSVESNQACGASGYTLDAPIPEVMFRKVRKKRRMRRAATNDGFKTWPQGKIPYTLSEKFSNTKRRLIRRSMKHWMNRTCVQFVPRTTEPDYIHIYGGNGCCSYVGRRGGKQYVSLGNGCNRFGIITHELGHAVGFWHEQNRPDRSIYVDVIYDNVDSSKYLNFDPRDSTEVDTFDQNYDFSSIMHYGSSFFSKNGGDTITAKLNARNALDAREELTKRIGSSYYKFKGPVLSTQDILETNLLYKCSKLTQECGGGTIFSSSGTFTSQNHPREYPLHTKQDCVWVLTTTTKSKGRKSSLTLQFDDFHVGNVPDHERHHSVCPDDYVEVREGKGFLSPFLVRYCGNRLPAPITTLTGSLYVRFHVSGKNSNQADQLLSGFKAKFKTDVCSSHLQKFPATIQSTDFPFGYKRSTDCLWVVEALPGMQIEIKFPFFSLREHNDRERCSDYLEIHKGDKQEEVFVGRYCGTKNPGTLLIRSENVKLHFHSSDLKESGWFLGFQAQINQLDINECSQGLHECQHECLNYPGGYFCGCHPGYKRSYLGDSNKAQCIDVDECSVNNGGCSHACANTDGSFVCACPEGYTLSENRTNCIDINECILPNRMCNQICTNTIGSYKCSCYEGFILQSNNYTCSGLIGCQGTMQSSSGRITPPIIPPSYAHILRCVWRVIAPSHLRLAFQVTLPWQQNNNCSSFLTFHDNERKRRRRIDTKKVCQLSDAADSLVMSGNTAVIEYVAQAPFQAPFRLQFYSVAPPKPQCLHTFNTTSGKFHTPGFPYKYPDHQECVWNIHAPSKKPFLVKVSAFRVEYHARCEYDFLDVEEVYYHVRAVKKIGRFCGTQGPQILRVDGGTCFLRLRFHSDATNAETGFKVEFTESGYL